MNECALKLQAIDQVQAIVEFNLDGTIITANENFLKITGYSLEDIKGRHHRMFCDAAYVASPEYHALWAKLNRGESESGLYQWIGKGGGDGADLLCADARSRWQADQGHGVGIRSNGAALGTGEHP
ncbi:MAG: PAS domain-containing protein [Nitrospira sp.]|nr:PAS domain-containing protein [Nitrospira sp.]